MGVEPNDEDLSSAKDYLQRCGTWRVHISTSEHFYYADGGSPLVEDTETSREFDIKWQPGDGPLGLFGSKIEGHGPIDPLRVTTNDPNCRFHDIKSERDSSAEIKLLEFDHYTVPMLAAAVPTFPKKFTLAVDLGKLDWWVKCGTSWMASDTNSGDGFDYQIGLAVQEMGITPTQEMMLAWINWDPYPIELSKKWQLSAQPFKAVLALSGTLYTDVAKTITHEVRYDVVVEHEPR
jgi:hypothetical protein